jgi:integrase
MGRPAKGSIVEPKKPGESWALRIPYRGQRSYVTLGREEDGWDRGKVEEERDYIMAQVRRGVWEPPQPTPIEMPKVEQTFLEFSNEWWELNVGEWSERTRKDYKWALELHVLPWFGEMLLGEITKEEVDRFKAAKLKEGRLAPPQINKCIKRISQILGLAEEYDRIPTNAARGRKRKAKEPEIERTWVEPEQALILVEESTDAMRPVVAMLLGTGARNGELCALDVPSVNLATATARVGKAKTDKGSYRELDLPGGVVDEVGDWLIRSEPMRRRYEAEHPGERPLFLTEHGGKVRRQTPANVARRLKTCIKRANKKLKKLGIEEISFKVTPHSLRRTYPSIRAVLGDEMRYTSDQLGHKDVRFTMNVYAKATKRPAKLKGVYLSEFKRTLAWAMLPTTDPEVLAGIGSQGQEAIRGVEVTV